MRKRWSCWTHHSVYGHWRSTFFFRLLLKGIQLIVFIDLSTLHWLFVLIIVFNLREIFNICNLSMHRNSWWKVNDLNLWKLFILIVNKIDFNIYVCLRFSSRGKLKGFCILKHLFARLLHGFSVLVCFRLFWKLEFYSVYSIFFYKTVWKWFWCD